MWNLKKYKKNFKNSKKGFTLIELVLTIAIICIVSTASLAIVWLVVNSHATTTDVAKDTQISSTTMENIHDSARVATNFSVFDMDYNASNKIDILNNNCSTRPEGSTAIYIDKNDNGKDILTIAKKQATGWEQLAQFDRGIEKAIFEITRTKLTENESVCRTTFSYIMETDRNRKYTGGVQMDNIKSLASEYKGDASVGGNQIVMDLLNPNTTTNKYIVLDK